MFTEPGVSEVAPGMAPSPIFRYHSDSYVPPPQPGLPYSMHVVSAFVS